MGWFDKWLSRPIKLTDGEFWRGFFGSGTTSGEVVDYEKALGLDTVWACVSVIQDAVGTLNCIIYDSNTKEIRKDLPLYDLLHDVPNMDETAPEFWSMAAFCLCMDGNFFAEKKMSGSRLIALNPIPPLLVEVCRTNDGKNTRYYEVTEKGKTRKIPEDRMFHVRGKLMPGCDRGMSPIAIMRNTVGNALAGEHASGKIFSGGMMSSMLLTTETTLKPEQRKQIGDTLRQQVGGASRAGSIAVLEAGLTPHMVSLNPDDAQMLETRQFSVEQICRMFGVPPVMIGHAANGTTTWGSGIEQLILQFTKTCMRPMLKRIEATIRRDLMTAKERRDLTVKFNMEELLRGDSAARAEFVSKMIGSGAYTINEAREYEDKPPVEGGNVSLVNGTMTPVTMLGHNGGPPMKTSPQGNS